MLVYVSAREKEKELQAPLFSGRNAPILHLPPFPSLPSIITSLFPFLAFRGFRRRRRRAITTEGEGRSEENNPSKSGLSLYILYVQRTREGRFLFFSYVQTMVRHFWQKDIRKSERDKRLQTIQKGLSSTTGFFPLPSTYCTFSEFARGLSLAKKRYREREGLSVYRPGPPSIE